MAPEQRAGAGLNGDAQAAEFAPVTATERVRTIDTIRGVAVLGILPMNIPFFALSAFAWLNPTISGPLTGWDGFVWRWGHLIFEAKMMSIFSMLFGAGLAIMAMRADARGARLGPIYYRRLFWLLVIGLIHAYLIWYGDILVMYALCGLLLYPLRKLKPRLLVLMGIAMVLIAVPINMGHGFALDAARREAAEPLALVEQGQVLTLEQQESVDKWTEMSADFYPTPDMLEEEAQVFRHDWIGLLRRHAGDTIWFQTFGILLWGLWRAGGLMILGMGLLRLGVLSGARSVAFYLAMIVIGYAAGFPMIAWGIRENLAHEFEAIYMFKKGFHFNYIGSLFVAAGHVGLVILLCKLGVVRAVTSRLAAVGRMALTNYLAQSLICTAIFYPWGFRMWGDLGRAELFLYVVLPIWALQLIWSPIWLSRFRYGPMEWLWRSLTYWKWQPMRRLAGANDGAPAD